MEMEKYATLGNGLAPMAVNVLMLHGLVTMSLIVLMNLMKIQEARVVL